MAGRVFDVDTARRRLDFSTESVQSLMNKPFNLFLEWMLEQIGRAVAVDRIAYLRSGKNKQDLYLAAGYGNHLPLVGSRQIRVKSTELDKLQDGGWFWNPTKDVGWDAFFSFYSNGQLGVLAIDDTASERVFNEADQEYLIRSANWFGVCYKAKQDIQNDQDLAVTDNLTRLPNQRSCSKQLRGLVQNLLNQEIQTACIAVIDVDNFKHANDNHGHAFGDMILKQLAEIINQDKKVFAGRYGGEEFILIMQTTQNEAYLILNDYLKQFQNINLPNNYRSYKASFSGGLYSIQPGDLLEHESDIKKIASSLFEKADTLMYKAKKSGKARICSA